MTTWSQWRSTPPSSAKLRVGTPAAAVTAAPEKRCNKCTAPKAPMHSDTNGHNSRDKRRPAPRHASFGVHGTG
eukprot:CAMPEP_0183476740 /NCGR_PEP_ID=MMETSP0370-20130417/166958_1 /TAXON_ID=268820 /ORGANISM="Peridinium aciculiferum, Strain PAER-2" /LENGTH=72 /DNA_ID=CAMNT_0025669607 /DNA_START=589 /DNA_END=803 /DNA_ORIENTATION=-